jgi:hypothetical protein
VIEHRSSAALSSSSDPQIAHAHDAEGFDEALDAPDYVAHPLLDPDLFHRDRYALRYFMRLFRDSMRNDWQYSRVLNRLLHPVGQEHPVEVNERILSSFFEDASIYLRELLSLLRDDHGRFYLPDALVDDCSDLRSLGRLLFHHDDPDPRRARIIRFEAQRKLYLTKLLIQIEHTRMVQDGPRHRRYLLELLDRELWDYVTAVRDHQARFHPGVGGSCALGERPESWHFRVQKVQRDLPGGSYDLEVFHFDTRFKKEVAGYDYAPGQRDYEVAERPRYEHMKRSRSASILSKMLRKGINNPNGVTDMLGAKFIVGSERDVHRLADLLHQVLGGLFLFRNQVDLFRRPEDRARLNRFSARDFLTFKEDVDILYAPGGGENGRSYLFSVELQIFTVESFLQTLHSTAYASHTEYKRRQFLQGVMPYVFPESVYGPLQESPSGP